MSFELMGVLRLQDRMSRELRTVTGNILSTTGRLTGLTAGIGAVTAAFTGASGAVKMFNSTIGAAANAEMAKLTMTALFRDNTKAASEYYDFLQQKGAESTLSDTDFMSASKTFVIMTKNLDELKEVTNIAERLAIMDPAQGIEGAALALRELNSGEITSLAERFEMPRSVLRDIKNLPLKAQLKALDKELSNYGITQDLIFAQGNTALGLYRKSVDKTRMAFRDMGFGALEELKPMLRDVNTWLDNNSATITKFGSNILTEMTGGFRGAFDYIRTNYLENPEFMKLPFADKIDVVLDELKTGWNMWYDTTGAEMIKSTTQGIVDQMANIFGSETNINKLAGIGMDLGKSLGTGLINSLNGLVEKHPLLSGVMAGIITPGPAPVKAAAAATTTYTGITKPMNDWLLEKTKKIPTLRELTGIDIGGALGIKREETSSRPVSKFSGGISRVPKTMPAILHRDETVLHRGEARNYRNGGSGGGVNVTGNTFVVRQESDINEIAAQLYRLVNDAENAMGGAY